MEPRTDRPRLWLTASLGTLLAVSMGAGLGWWLRGGVAQAASLPPEPATGVTREEIDGLKSELLARLDELARVPATHSPVSSDGPVIELGRRIDALESRVALAGKRVDDEKPKAHWTPPRGPGSGSIDAIIERMRAWYGIESSQRSGIELRDLLRQEYDLWTFDDLVAAYGAPRRWERQGREWILYYGSFAVAGMDDRQSVSFDVRDDYVRTVDMRMDEP